MLTGRGRFTGDFTRPGMLHAAFARSPTLSARRSAFAFRQRRHVELRHEQVDRTGQDLDLALDRVGLALFVEGHDHGGGTIAEDGAGGLAPRLPRDHHVAADGGAREDHRAVAHPAARPDPHRLAVECDLALVGDRGAEAEALSHDSEALAGDVVGLVFLGYPLHPPGAPLKLRVEHLDALPTLAAGKVDRAVGAARHSRRSSLPTRS